MTLSILRLFRSQPAKAHAPMSCSIPTCSIRSCNSPFVSPRIPNPQPNSTIGQVKGSDLGGTRQTQIGNVQAWYYHQDQILVLWECFLQPRLSPSFPVRPFGYPPERIFAHNHSLLVPLS
jgi:hypothetical protein